MGQRKSNISNSHIKNEEAFDNLLISASICYFKFRQVDTFIQTSAVRVLAKSDGDHARFHGNLLRQSGSRGIHAVALREQRGMVGLLREHAEGVERAEMQVQRKRDCGHAGRHRDLLRLFLRGL